jgi:hypothetical protein
MFPIVKRFLILQKYLQAGTIVLGWPRVCENIMNIHHLTIYACKNLASSKGLKNITESVNFQSCIALKSINDLQNIPVVTIEYCAMVTDFSGLGNNENLTMRGESLGFRFFRNANPDVMKTIKQLNC